MEGTTHPIEKTMAVALDYGTRGWPPSPRSVVVATSILVCVLMLMNGALLAAAWQDRSWGAFGIGIFYGPISNGLVLVVAPLLTPVLWKFSGQWAAMYLVAALLVPVGAVIADALIILAMGLHGC
jgi:hypothetical protein